jgi:hypothetical protein
MKNPLCVNGHISMLQYVYKLLSKMPHSRTQAFREQFHHEDTDHINK